MAFIRTIIDEREIYKSNGNYIGTFKLYHEYDTNVENYYPEKEYGYAYGRIQNIAAYVSYTDGKQFTIPTVIIANGSSISGNITNRNYTLYLKRNAYELAQLDGTFPDINYVVTLEDAYNENGEAIAGFSGVYTPQGSMQPQNATLISAPNFSEEQQPTITFSRSTSEDNRVVKSIEAIISLDGTQDDITRDITDIEASNYTFELTAAEVQLLKNSLNNSHSRQVIFRVKTNAKSSGIKPYYSDLTKVFSSVEAYPTATIAIEDVDTTTLALTGNKRKFIKYYSDAAYELNAVASTGATIERVEVSNASQKSEAASGIFENVESNTFSFIAVDNFDLAVAGSTTIDMIDYIKLTCNQKIEIALENETGAAGSITVSGNYWRGNFGAVNNTLVIQTRQTDENGNYGEWVTLTDFVEVEYKDNTYSLTVGISGMNYAIPYKFQCRAVDKLATAITEEYTTRITPVFDWGENDFNFNVPVTFNKEVNFTSAFGFNTDVEFNGNIVIKNETLADYVVEVGSASMGSNGTWRYRKWASGKAECYGCRNFGNMAVTTAWGGLYRSESFNQALPEELFIDTPEVIEINYRGSNFGGWICRHEATNADSGNTGGFILVRPASATIQQVPISFNVVGRWKY